MDSKQIVELTLLVILSHIMMQNNDCLTRWDKTVTEKNKIRIITNWHPLLFTLNFGFSFIIPWDTKTLWSQYVKRGFILSLYHLIKSSIFGYFVIVQWYMYRIYKCLYPRVQSQETLMGYMMKKIWDDWFRERCWKTKAKGGLVVWGSI